jgi:hypothetical protein
MLAGHNMNNSSKELWPGNDVLGIHAFRDFVYRVWRDGYFTTPAFMPIVDGFNHNAVNQYGEVDITVNNFRVRHPSQNRPSQVHDMYATPCKLSILRATSYICTDS